MKKYLEIGKITNTHALKGELKMVYWCDEPELLTNIEYLFLDDQGRDKIKIQNSRVHKNFLIIKFENIENIEKASSFINKILYISRDEIPLKNGEYFQCDLIGLETIDIDSGQSYGKIFKITQTGASDVYYLKDEQGIERLIPAIKDVIKNVDLENKTMLIRPLEGLFDV